ncbi:MAG: hypothetical protein MAG431_01645 [Chloroflexi bacterium]|nr:hypothetical protein [Chloroflexota bacterium]
MKVVSNTSPFVSLGRIGNLNLLHQVYGDLLVPEAVWQEVVIDGSGLPGAVEVREADWINVQEIVNKPLVRSLCQSLDAGEAEAIALALEVDADLLIMDERLGREVAQHFGMRYIGLIGVLMEARQRGFVDSIKIKLDQLRDVAGFRISEKLYARILEECGE